MLQITYASCDVVARFCSDVRILAFRHFAWTFQSSSTIKRPFLHPQGKHRLSPFPVFAKYSFWLLVFRCFYTPLEMSSVLFPWLHFLKSSFGSDTTCMTQKIFSDFSVEQASLWRGCDCQWTGCIIRSGSDTYVNISLFSQKLFPTHLPLDQKTCAWLQRADLMIQKEKPWPRVTEYVQLIKRKAELPAPNSYFGVLSICIVVPLCQSFWVVSAYPESSIITPSQSQKRCTFTTHLAMDWIFVFPQHS